MEKFLNRETSTWINQVADTLKIEIVGDFGCDFDEVSLRLLDERNRAEVGDSVFRAITELLKVNQAYGATGQFQSSTGSTGLVYFAFDGCSRLTRVTGYCSGEPMPCFVVDY